MHKAPALLVGVGLLLAVAGLALGGDHRLTFTVDGDSSGDRLGHGCAGAGDVNADGHDDFIAGAYYGNGSHAGYARVYSGKDAKVLYTFNGSSGYDGFGVSVNAAGDVNADGYADVIVGSHLDDTGGTDSGRAQVFSGKDGKRLYSWTGDGSGDRFGLTANGAGDVNADGYDDLVVGAYYTNSGGAAGYAKVFSGKDGKALYKWTGNSTRDYFGVYVSGAGDVNADGYDDVAVGACLDDTKGTDSGMVKVYSGKTGSVLYTFYGDRSGAYFGRCVDGAGDVNLDGYDDIVAGAYLDDVGSTDTGTVKVYSGKDGAVLYTWRGDSYDDRLGVHVDGGGDLNGDGYPDVIAGAYRDDENGGNCGSMRAYSGKDGSTLYTFYGKNSDVYLGRFAGILGDANGDGYDDIVAGAYGEDYGGTDSGRVYVWLSPAPSGTLAIEEGDDVTGSTSVTLSVTGKAGPDGDEVTEMRLRNKGDAWGGWTTLAASVPWTLPSGDGVKTVEMQVRDEVGATSGVIRDSILLDQTAPTGTVAINENYHTTVTIFVSLTFEYTDLQSGVTDLRIRNEGQPWGNWRTADDRISWALQDIDGIRTVEAQFRDAAGNESDIVADSIQYLADVVAPTIDSVRVNGGSLYILPHEPLEFGVYARDDLDGAGMDAFKLKFSVGGTWSDWYTLSLGPLMVVERPDASGLLSATVIARDKARNESREKQVSFFLLKEDLTWIGAGAKVAGTLRDAREVDAVEMGLVAGDLLTVKVKGKSFSKGTPPELLLDLVRMDGERLVEDRFPADSKKPMIKSFPVPETGRYL
ncbi:MAG: hypothetical protein ABFS86_15200, partial [Planctomycetota bacterium]